MALLGEVRERERVWLGGDVLGQRIRAVKARVYRNVACVCAEHVRALCAVPHGVGDPGTHEIHAFNVLDRTGQVEDVGVSAGVQGRVTVLGVGEEQKGLLRRGP